MMNLLRLVKEDLAAAPKQHGGEYHSPCPFCAMERGDGGDDRFVLWPEAGRAGLGAYWCRQCDTKGDAVGYLMAMRGMGYVEACQTLGAEHLVTQKSAKESATGGDSVSAASRSATARRAREAAHEREARRWQDHHKALETYRLISVMTENELANYRAACRLTQQPLCGATPEEAQREQRECVRIIFEGVIERLRQEEEEASGPLAFREANA